MSTFEGLPQAYVDNLRGLLFDATYRNSPRGFASKEEVGVTFKITDPLQRLVLCPTRRSNLAFNFAECLWYLCGRNDLEFLAYYAPTVRKYSADGLTLTGTAYGPRLFQMGVGQVDQWQSVRRTLDSDPDSKRAVVQIFQPEELLVEDNIDVACTLALQFLIRDHRLELVAFMRANDAYRGILSDIFSFTLIQEVMARQLGLEVGHYTHMVGSMHLYEPDESRAFELLSRADATQSEPMPSMPSGDPFPDIRMVASIEQSLRRNSQRLMPADLDELALPVYWKQVVAVFEAYRCVRYGDEAGAVMSYLQPTYRALLANRFEHLARVTL